MLQDSVGLHSGRLNAADCDDHSCLYLPVRFSLYLCRAEPGNWFWFLAIAVTGSNAVFLSEGEKPCQELVVVSFGWTSVE